MSWDLRIALHERPELEAQTFEVDGPSEIEADDLDPALAAAVLAPRWLVEVSIPESAPAAKQQAATKWAQALAERYRGAVYDPQAERVLWPKRARAVKMPKSERIRVVDMHWWMPPSRCVDAGAALLASARTHLPEALPRRFGEFEPLPDKYDDQNPDPFLTAWGYMPRVLFWSATSPCFGGNAFFPNEFMVRTYDRGQKQVLGVTLHFDSRVLESEPTWREATVDFFRHAASKMGAFCGAAVVARNVLARGRGLGYDGLSEKTQLPRATWAGLPSLPLWLGYYGPPYADLVGKSFVRATDAPADIEQAAKTFPPLPPELVSTDWQTRVAAQLPDLK